ncbi:glycosyltransferase [Caulobacter segnis]|uniref:glycosyltransferase n=1 Tax=Caulobacter segnis TaxID=88688 RepID=UPI00240FF361|nr:glycosyltransferase [Caulobacter segnis]MDG2520301.1 glycosyltransferase [Caulobacter segnis]
MARDLASPTVSVLMANHNGARHLAEAVRSVLASTLSGLELIVVDDASTDDSIALLSRLAESDPRMRVLARPSSGGPGAARNLALSQAQGEFLAVVDSDDFIHPERLEALVAEARGSGAHIVIDDLLIFADDGGSQPRTLLRGDLAKRPQWIALPDYIRSNRLYGSAPSLGFAKPLIRRQVLAEAGVTYAEDLPVGEDFDLIARAMGKGMTLWCTPRIAYFYRKHPQSISHRLDRPRLEAMAANAVRLRQAVGSSKTAAALSSLEASIDAALGLDDIVLALKARRPAAALAAAMRTPAGAALLRVPVQDKLGQALARLRGAERAADGAGKVVVLSRQRVVGSTNGSSTYLLSLCRALREAGHRVTWLGPTPATFGRWPVLKLSDEMALFDAVRIRGGLRVGRWVVAKDPRILGRALLTGIEKGLAKLKLKPSGWVKPAPYAIAAPATRADQMFVARHARGAKALLCDYAFAAPLAPYALTPAARRLVVMHDLFSSRAAQFAAVGGSDSVAALSAEAEYALLGQADIILAVQQDEAAAVAANLPGRQVVTTPIAADPVSSAAPGRAPEILFVGSNTAPNVVGLHWLFDKVWPALIARRPDARLTVVGNVSRALDGAPQGVTVLGPVPDLAPLYAGAAVVVSPLITGSGLKIKLVEALAAGKAVVATSVSLQGVERELSSVVRRADEPEVFAAHIADLLDDDEARAALAAAGLAAARDVFGARACYGPMLSLIAEPA